MVTGIIDLGWPSDSTDNIWALTMGPNGGDTVYGGTSAGTAHGGKLFKYDGNGFTIIDEVSGEYAIKSLVTADDSIYGGTRDNGHFFSYYPGGSINDWGTLITGDSSITALVMGPGVKDHDWVYGGTSQKGYYSGGYGEYNGGHVFVFKPESTLIRNLGRPAESQRNIYAITGFIKPGHIGWMCPGTGPDSTYVGVRCGGDCDQAEWDSFTVWPHSGSAPWVSGLCNTDSDSVYGITCDVALGDSSLVFLFIWGGNPDSMYKGKLFDAEYRAGPMVAGSDGNVYFNSISRLGGQDTPRFYRWSNRIGAWSPGSGINNNPRYWTYVDQNGDITRYRSLAYAGNGYVYIGTGNKSSTKRAHLLKFVPGLALGGHRSGQELTQRDRRGDTAILQIYPNPCRGEAQVAYSIPGEACASLELKVHDTAGRTVRTLTNGQARASSGIALWDGLDECGGSVPAGTYFCTLSAGALSRTEKLTLLK
jgi:hypothetical protein